VKKFWVSIPVCYYEVFEVHAETRKEAIEKASDGGADGVDQVCTDANRNWSRRVLVEERNEEIKKEKK
jgi:hypothetical protein